MWLPHGSEKRSRPESEEWTSQICPGNDRMGRSWRPAKLELQKMVASYTITDSLSAHMHKLYGMETSVSSTVDISCPSSMQTSSQPAARTNWISCAMTRLY